jgi:hypothetical protein
LLAGWLPAWLAGWLADWLACCLAGWLPACLAGWLSAWLAGWLAGWPAGWLAGRLAPPLILKHQNEVIFYDVGLDNLFRALEKLSRFWHVCREVIF